MTTKTFVLELDNTGYQRGSYWHSWYCNLCMATYDAARDKGIKHKLAMQIGENAAARFMKRAFDFTVLQDWYNTEY